MLHLTYKQNNYCIYIHQCGYPIESLASTSITEIRMYLFCMRTSVAGTITDTRFRIQFMCHGYEFPIYRLTHPFVQCIIPFFAWHHISLYSISLPFVQGITSFCTWYHFPLYNVSLPFIQDITPFFAGYHFTFYTVSSPFVQGI